MKSSLTHFLIYKVENEEHCEFIYLRNFLTRTHLQDLIETTAQIHYEAFRAKQLMAIKESTQPTNPSPGSAASPHSVASNALSNTNSAMDSPGQSAKSVTAFA